MAEGQNSERDEVLHYFNLAAQERTTINLYFIWEKCQISVVRAPCIMVKKGLFVVRALLSDLDREPLIWGAEVNGYFTVREDDMVACHFKSRLARLYNAPPDAMLLIFPLPRVVDHGQQRFSRRVNIDRDSAQGFGIWYGAMEGGDLTSLPQQRWLPFENEICELGELSASGMRLDFRRDHPLVGKLSVNDPILLKGDFGYPSKPASIFALGDIVRKMPRKDTEGLMSVGCHFRSWRRLDGKENETWFRADPREGIGIINQWLSRNFRSIAQRK